MRLKKMTKYKVILEFELEGDAKNFLWSAHKVTEYLHYNERQGA